MDDGHEEYDDLRRQFRYLKESPDYEPGPRRDLMNLRLTSRAACKAASPLFFQEFDARLPTSEGKLVAANWRQRLVEFSQRPWIEHVKTLRVGTGRAGKSCAVKTAYDPAWGEAFFAAAADAAPHFTEACSALRTIRFDYDFEEDADEIEHERNLTILTIHATLAQSSPTLRTLAITLPFTSHFGSLYEEISRTPSSQALLSRLENLSVECSNFYSPAGTGLWRFLQLVPGVKALAIRMTHIVDFPYLSTVSFTSLRELHLEYVKISGKKLGQVAQESAHSLREIRFNFVELTSGTWAGAFQAFSELPSLLDFRMDTCYYLGAENSFLDRLTLHEEHGTAFLESKHRQDYDALRELRRHVNALRAARALEPYVEAEYLYRPTPRVLERNYADDDDPWAFGVG